MCTRCTCDWRSDVCSADLMIRRPPRSTLFPTDVSDLGGRRIIRAARLSLDRGLLEPLRVLLAELRDLGLDDRPAVRLRRIVLEVLLVVRLGLVERRGAGDLGHD